MNNLAIRFTDPNTPEGYLNLQVDALQKQLQASEARYWDKTALRIDDTHIRELCKFDIASFAVSSPAGYPIYTVTNHAGRAVSYQLSWCSGFCLKYLLNIDGAPSYFGVGFRREDGSHGYFEIEESRLTSRNVFLGFIRAGGTFCIRGSDTKKGELLLSFLISLYSVENIEPRTNKLWLSTSEGVWLLNDIGSANFGVLNKEIDLTEIEWEMLRGYAALKLRLLPLGVQINSPVLWLSEHLDDSWISVNQREKTLEAELLSSDRVMNEIWLADIGNENHYIKSRAKANILKLQEISKNHHSFDVLVSKDLNEYTTGWLPIKPISRSSKYPKLDFSWREVCETIRANSDSFESAISSTVQFCENRYGGNEYKDELTAFICVGKTLSWFLFMKGYQSLSLPVKTMFLRSTDILAAQWDALDDEDDIERFSESMYKAVDDGSIVLYDKRSVPDSAGEGKIEAFYDESRLYLTTQALRKVLEGMSDVSEPMILRMLETAGLLRKQNNGTGKSTFFVKTTMHFLSEKKQRIRVLPLPREMFFRPGRIDITKIIKKEEYKNENREINKRNRKLTLTFKRHSKSVD